MNMNGEHRRRTETLATLGGLMGGAAHDLGSPLGIGVTSASHLGEITRKVVASYRAGRLKRADLESFFSSVTESSDLIRDNLDRAARLARAIKQVADDGDSNAARAFELEPFVQSALLTLRPLYKKRPISLELRIPTGLLLRTFPSPLWETLAELIGNAAMHGFVSARPGRLLLEAWREGEQVALLVADDGVGMDARMAAGLFDERPPGEETRGVERRRGLDRVLVCVRDGLGGKVSCESAPGEGARFRLRFPCEWGRRDG